MQSKTTRVLPKSGLIGGVVLILNVGHSSDKVLFFSQEVPICVLFLHKNMLWYSLEAPHRGASNEYHNVFLWRNKKNSMQISILELCKITGKPNLGGK